MYIHTHPNHDCRRPRFIDDILVVWDEGPDELKKFIEHLNSWHLNIKFSEEISSSEVSVFDILIAKSAYGRLRTDLFSKMTDANKYLHYSLAHTKSCRDGLITANSRGLNESA